MKTKINISFLLLFLISSLNLFAKDSPIYEFEKKLRLGDKSALFELVPYFDSNKEIIECLGYHIINTNESQVARRIVNENSVFTENELIISKNTTSKQFSDFLIQNKNKIVFSELAQAFLLTPIEKRVVTFEIREISAAKKTELKNNAASLKNLEWVKTNNIDSLIQLKDPEALLLIASELFKKRYRFNNGYHMKEEFTNLLQLLTGTEIAVKNEKKELTWHIDKEFYHDASLNLLIYFATNYQQYKWDESLSIFTNTNYTIQLIEKEELLFQLLNNKNDSIAQDAFTQLTTCQTQKVIQLSNEYEKANMDHSYAIPTFPYKFLKQIVLLTEYCNNNSMNFTGSLQLRNDIKKLSSKLSFNERRALENRIINSMTLDQITAFEYWAIINEESYSLTYSAGRILDIFYSKNWNKLIENDAAIKLYLKKSNLFNELGIIGVCNNYLKKFQNSNETTIMKLNALQTMDENIKKEIIKAKSICLIKTKESSILKKEFDGNKDVTINDIENKITTTFTDSSKTEDELVKLLSQISYHQIGISLEAIENVQLKIPWKKYSFMERDFGFFMIDHFDSIAIRNDFLKRYNSLSEYDMYSYYLDHAGIDYKNSDHSLNYDKIVDLLKYDVVVAFVGGGGGTQDNEVYSLIKLLEIKHQTTLGFPHKLCNSNGVYGCDSKDRAKEWLHYFKDKKLIKEEHDEPISFND
jgi:hypothetical protein